jgi:hypothetical protein
MVSYSFIASEPKEGQNIMAEKCVGANFLSSIRQKDRKGPQQPSRTSRTFPQCNTSSNQVAPSKFFSTSQNSTTYCDQDFNP